MSSHIRTKTQRDRSIMNTTPEMMAYLRSWAGPIPLIHRGLEWSVYQSTPYARGLLEKAHDLEFGKYAYYDLEENVILVGKTERKGGKVEKNPQFDKEYFPLSRMIVAEAICERRYLNLHLRYTISHRGELMSDFKNIGHRHNLSEGTLRYMKEKGFIFTITNPVLFWGVALKSAKLTSALDRYFDLTPSY